MNTAILPVEVDIEYPAALMSTDQPNAISTEEVRHVATLARLLMTEEDIEACRGELGAILGHIETINAVDTEGIEPLAHSIDMTNRLSKDDVEPSLDIEDVLANAPSIQDRYIAVPKVLNEDGNN